MAELDRFETRFAAAYGRYLDEAPTAVDAAAVARMAAAQPRTRVIARPWALLPVRGLAWVLLGALLLAAMGAAALLVGSQRPPLGFVCPAGTNPDAPGPVDQARPPLGAFGSMAFDRRAGRIVMVAGTIDTDHPETWTPETWTFDVCTNTWARMRATGGPVPSLSRNITYDTGADLTIAVDEQATWAYDLDADRWDRKSDAPPGLRSLVYDPVADLVLASDEAAPIGLWAYDAGADRWTPVPQANPPRLVGLMAYDASDDRIVAARPMPPRTKSIWLFDPRGGTWSEAGRWELPVGYTTYVPPLAGYVTYADSLERTVAVNFGLTLAYDASADRWDTLDEAAAGPMDRVYAVVVYDPVNERIVRYGGAYGTREGTTQSDDVLAFDLATREWIVLLEAANVHVDPVHVDPVQ